jgi:cell wall-associated NlpC family hydrolase
MIESDARAALVAEAKTWLGTPWHHRARVKGVGVDCAQFLIGVYAGAGLIEGFDTGDYPRDWHIHRDEERFLPFVQRFAAEIPEADAKPGDVILVKIGRVFSHGAILLDWPQAIHAAVQDQRVTLCDLDRDLGLFDRPRRYFSYWPTALKQRAPASDRAT